MPAPTITRPTAVQLRDSLMEAGDKLRELRESKPEDRGETWAEDVRSTTQTIHQLDAELTAAERTETRSRGPRAAMEGLDDEPRSAGEAYIRSEAYASRGGRYHGGNLPDVEVRALITSSTSDTPAAGVWLPKGQPVTPAPRQMRFFVRDLLAVQETSLASIPYIRELNAATNETGATSVAEGAEKPEVTMSFETVDAVVRKIAAWVPVTTEIVDDAPSLRGYIDTRLAYMLGLREQDQIINGNGTAPNLRGILNTTGIQTQAAVAGDFAATVGRAVGKVENVDGEADGIVMNPTDFWTMITTRFANQLDAGYGGSLPFGPPPNTLWGLRVVRSRALAAGKALVGSFFLGATLFDRQQTMIRVGDQHSDYFTSNKLVVLAEERVALAVHRPDFFVDTTL